MFIMQNMHIPCISLHHYRQHMELSKSKATVIASLGSKKMRLKHKLFTAEGEKCALDTIGAFELDCLVATPAWISLGKLKQESLSAPIFSASPETLKKISSLSSPPDVIAVFRLPSQSVPALSLDASSLYLALDGIQDPGNLGTIIRTADWFGVETIFASRDTADIFNPKTIQATMGSLKRVRVVYTDLADVISANPGMPLCGTLLDGKDIFQTSLPKGAIIVMGNEGNGISDEVKKMVTHPLLIPPYRNESHGESLNVAIATAITLAQFRGR